MTKPPFRADHVGSLLRPKRLLEARERRARGEIAAEALRAVEDEASREAVSLQEEVGLQGITDGEFRRTFFHVDFLEQIEGVEVVESGFTASFRRDDGIEVNFTPPTMRVDRQAAPRHEHPGRRLRVPQRPDHADAQGLHPLALDAPFPRRPRGDRRRALSRPRGFLRRSRRGLSRRDRRPRRPRLPLSAARRHQPRLSVRPDRSASRPAPAATIRTNCRGPTAADQRGDTGPPGRHGGRHPPVPGQLPQRLGRPGRLRAGRRDPVQRARRRRLLPRIRRRALGRFLSTPLRAPRAKPWCSGS